MPNKIKLNLQELNIESFVTTDKKTAELKGGYSGLGPNGKACSGSTCNSQEEMCTEISYCTPSYTDCGTSLADRTIVR